MTTIIEELPTPAVVDWKRPNAGHQLRNHPFLQVNAQDRSGSELKPTIHLSQLAQSLPCSAVIEERNRLAREIHDTLAQQFAGILWGFRLTSAKPALTDLDCRRCVSEPIAWEVKWTSIPDTEPAPKSG